MSSIFDSDAPIGDVLQVEETAPLVAGWYRATIKEAKAMPTKDNTGERVALQFAIIGAEDVDTPPLQPERIGEVIFGSLNVKNSSPRAESIGKRQFAKLLDICAIDLKTISPRHILSSMVGTTLAIKLAVKEASGDYPAGNEVKDFARRDGTRDAYVAESSAAVDAGIFGTMPAAPPEGGISNNFAAVPNFDAPAGAGADYMDDIPF